METEPSKIFTAANEPPAQPESSWAKTNHRFRAGWSDFASGRGGTFFVFGWAVAEATVWPVIPDFALAPLEVMDRRKSWRLLLASAVGSGLGSLLLFSLTRRNPACARRIIEKMPLAHGYHFGRVEQKLEKNWVKTLIMQPWSGVPAKIVVTVGAEKGSLTLAALPVLVLARTFRMVVVVGIARLFGKIFRRPLETSSLAVFILYLIFFFPVWWQIVKDRSKAQK